MKGYTFVDYATQAYIGLVGLLVLLFHNGTVPAWPWFVAGHAAGLALIHWLVTGNKKAQDKLGRTMLGGYGWKALDFLRHFYPVILYTGLFCETAALNRMFFKDYLDPIVIRWDQRMFGSQPSVVLMQKMPWLPVSELLYAAYFSYYVMIVGVGIALFLRDRRQFFHYVSVVSFVFYACYLIYVFVPVIGPMTFFHRAGDYALPPEMQMLAGTDSYPNSVQAGLFYKLMTWIYRVFEAPGAAIPSSHIAVALCTVWFSFRYLPRIRYPHLVAAILLCIATVYCRYHYALDVITGVAAAAVLIPLGNCLYVSRSERSLSTP